MLICRRRRSGRNFKRGIYTGKGNKEGRRWSGSMYTLFKIFNSGWEGALLHIKGKTCICLFYGKNFEAPHFDAVLGM